MKITRNTLNFLDPMYAPSLRFMQDQPMVTAWDLSAQSCCFATRIAQFVEAIGYTKKQRLAVERIIEKTGWVEPPRFRPFAETIERPHLHSKQPLYRVTLCPGLTSDDVYDDIQALAYKCPPGAEHELWIGPLYEYTRDVDDPRLQRTPSEKARGFHERYTTILHQILAKARAHGTLITAT